MQSAGLNTGLLLSAFVGLGWIVLFLLPFRVEVIIKFFCAQNYKWPNEIQNGKHLFTPFQSGKFSRPHFNFTLNAIFLNTIEL
jgi:hypothetical protein